MARIIQSKELYTLFNTGFLSDITTSAVSKQDLSSYVSALVNSSGISATLKQLLVSVYDNTTHEVIIQHIITETEASNWDNSRTAANTWLIKEDLSFNPNYIINLLGLSQPNDNAYYIALDFIDLTRADIITDVDPADLSEYATLSEVSSSKYELKFEHNTQKYQFTTQAEFDAYLDEGYYTNNTFIYQYDGIYYKNFILNSETKPLYGNDYTTLPDDYRHQFILKLLTPIEADIVNIDNPVTLTKAFIGVAVCESVIFELQFESADEVPTERIESDIGSLFIVNDTIELNVLKTAHDLTNNSIKQTIELQNAETLSHDYQYNKVTTTANFDYDNGISTVLGGNFEWVKFGSAFDTLLIAAQKVKTLEAYEQEYYQIQDKYGYVDMLRCPSTIEEYIEQIPDASFEAATTDGAGFVTTLNQNQSMDIGNYSILRTGFNVEPTKATVKVYKNLTPDNGGWSALSGVAIGYGADWDSEEGQHGCMTFTNFDHINEHDSVISQLFYYGASATYTESAAARQAIRSKHNVLPINPYKKYAIYLRFTMYTDIATNLVKLLGVGDQLKLFTFKLIQFRDESYSTYNINDQRDDPWNDLIDVTGDIQLTATIDDVESGTPVASYVAQLVINPTDYLNFRESSTAADYERLRYNLDAGRLGLVVTHNERTDDSFTLPTFGATHRPQAIIRDFKIYELDQYATSPTDSANLFNIDVDSLAAHSTKSEYISRYDTQYSKRADTLLTKISEIKRSFTQYEQYFYDKVYPRAVTIHLPVGQHVVYSNMVAAMNNDPYITQFGGLTENSLAYYTRKQLYSAISWTDWDELVTLAQSRDSANMYSVLKLMPDWMSNQDEQNSVAIPTDLAWTNFETVYSTLYANTNALNYYSRFLNMLGSYYDNTKLYLDNISRLPHQAATGVDSAPKELMFQLARLRTSDFDKANQELNSLDQFIESALERFLDTELKGYAALAGEGGRDLVHLEGSAAFTNIDAYFDLNDITDSYNMIIRRVLSEYIYLQKYKGTQNGIESLLNALGLSALHIMLQGDGYFDGLEQYDQGIG